MNEYEPEGCEIEVPSRQPFHSNVYGGTVEPTLVPLAAAQIPAIGSLGMCSGTLIAPRWVLTARHCPIEPGNEFCMGAQHDAPDVCIPTTRVIPHPTVDLALLELAQDPAERIPDIRPIPIVDEDLDCSRLGQMAEAAGYGRSPTFTFGKRFFTAEPIVGLSAGFVTIHGQGLQGLCHGDSGGPVMLIAEDGTARVAGALNAGDPSCRGRDDFARIDVVRDWVEGFIGPHGTPSRRRRM
ncbi:MAG TPA: trypsin-like serine protease [Haliangium sp.]|nr:trypsin-like serine protease [Haliangium sp.]